MIQEAFCSFEVVKLLHERGYTPADNVCVIYNERGESISLSDDAETYYQAPTHQVALAWLREKGVFLSFEPSAIRSEDVEWTIYAKDEYDEWCLEQENYADTYEEAVEAALTYALTQQDLTQ